MNILKVALTKGLQEKPFFLHTECSRVHWGNNPFLYKGIIRNPWETYGNSKRRIYYEIKETGLAFECRNGNFHTGRMRQQLRIERSVRPGGRQICFGIHGKLRYAQCRRGGGFKAYYHRFLEFLDGFGRRYPG